MGTKAALSLIVISTSQPLGGHTVKEILRRDVYFKINKSTICIYHLPYKV